MRGGYVAALILAVASFLATVAAFFVLLFVGALGGLGDSAKYGRVPLPGQGTVELPAGDISVFYEEHVTLGDNQNLRAPNGFTYSMRPAAGGAPLAQRDPGIFDEQVSSGGRTRIRYARIDVPAPGPYVVEGSFKGSAGPMPAITFGEPFIDRIFERVKYAGLGLIGIAVAVLLAIGTFLRRRLAPEDERVTMPPEGQ
ncbi:MAG: hypothetical protein ACXWEK_00290 [Solirubrobacterales bacterium]